MSPEQADRFAELLDETVVLFGSMSDKIMKGNPTWDELDTVLTDKERLMFDAFIAWSRSAAPPSEKGPVGP